MRKKPNDSLIQTVKNSTDKAIVACTYKPSLHTLLALQPMEVISVQNNLIFNNPSFFMFASAQT